VLFELHDVLVVREGREVLREITTRLPEGASCVAGPSGSGKSTLLRLLNRLADPERGEVRYRDVDVRELAVLSLRREVCLVPQLPALLEGSVADNVQFGAELMGHDTDLERVLELAGLAPDYADRDSARLSVGEQQRVMLARALALEPRVLLLDEPTSALDAETRGAVEQTLIELRERLAISIVLVTHDIAQARRLADWVVRLDAGAVVAEGPAGELIQA
jgi:putative ABC transport system ATP-binding protein